MRSLDQADDLKLLKMRDTSFLVAPIPEHAFFKQAVFQNRFRQRFFQSAHLLA